MSAKRCSSTCKVGGSRGLMLASVVSAAAAAMHLAAPASSTGTNGAGATLSQTAKVHLRKKDLTAPSTPARLRVLSSTGSAIRLDWSASRDNVGVVRYRVYVNLAFRATTSSTAHTVTTLSCGTAYTLAVAAIDAAGNRSSLASLVSSTTPCSST